MKRIGLSVLSAVAFLACPATTKSSVAAEPVKEDPAPAVAAADPKPAETKPAEVKPAETKPAEAKVADATPAETKPAEVKPAETKPADTKPADTKKADAKPADTKPAETKTDAKPVEKKGGAYTLVAVAAPDKKTERQWKSKCSSCHGSDGKADTEKGHEMKMTDLSAASWQTAHGNDELKKAVHDGVKRTKGGVNQQMDPFGDELSAEQIDALVQYVRFLGAPK